MTVTDEPVPSSSQFVALIPAAGRASRLGNIPCSKELIPLQRGHPEHFAAKDGSRVVIEQCLHGLAENGIREAIIATTDAKRDIADYLASAPDTGVDFRIIAIPSTPSVPHTLCHVSDAVAGRNVLLVFPDIVISPPDTAGRLVRDFADSNVDVMLATLPTDRGDKVDLVIMRNDAEIVRIVPKPGAGHAGWTWVLAAWRPVFTEFLAEFVATREALIGTELNVADVLNAALRGRLRISAVSDPGGVALDIGTPDDLQRLWRGFLQE